MNIFYVDDNPISAAKNLCDKHVVKMILESAQMLSTAHFVLDGKQVAYKACYVNHPCNVWVRECTGNYDWLASHFCGLMREYTFRYGKTHKCFDYYHELVLKYPIGIKRGIQTEAPLCMPDEYRVIGDPVSSYKNYYNGAKMHLFKWTQREVPEWVVI